MDKNQFNDTDDTREKVSSTRRQRLRRKRKHHPVMLKRCATSPLTLVVEGVEENEKSLKVKNTQSNTIHGVIPMRERALRVRSRPKLLTVGDEHCHSRRGASKEQPARFDFQQ